MRLEIFCQTFWNIVNTSYGRRFCDSSENSHFGRRCHVIPHYDKPSNLRLLPKRPMDTKKAPHQITAMWSIIFEVRCLVA
jgi:hypothetical protein